MQEETQVIEAQPTPSLLLGKSAIGKAGQLATQLKKIIEEKKLYSEIEGKKFVIVEGWTTLGALMGVFPRVTETKNESGAKMQRILIVEMKKGKFGMYEKKRYIDPEMAEDGMNIVKKPDGTDIRTVTEFRYRAAVALYHANGQLLSTAEAVCSNLEGEKINSPDYAILSMAQTRATGKVFRLAFSWIMQMAGYEVTPAEEMAEFGRGQPSAGEHPKAPDSPLQRDLNVTRGLADKLPDGASKRTLAERMKSSGRYSDKDVEYATGVKL